MKRTIAFFLLLVSLPAISQIVLPRLISNGMVLQRDISLKIWGWSSPLENIQLQFKGRQFRTKADPTGNWSISLPAQPSGGPYEMSIRGNNEVRIKDILIGDVWVCSGQSNMELTMERVKYRYPGEIAGSRNNYIRQFLVPDKYNFLQPQNNTDAGTWLAADPQTILDFSAVAWFFARALYAKHKIPIGLINTALGGSPAEAWISEEALKAFPVYYDEVQKFKDQQLINEIEAKDRKISSDWYQQLNAGDEGLKNKWPSPSLNDHDWQQMNIPGYWPDIKEGPSNGSVWFRTTVKLTPSATGQPARLELGRIVDADSVFVNGMFAGTTSYQYPPRRYELPSGMLKAGTNSIVIRVISNSGRGGFVPDKFYRLITPKDTIDLTGSWKYKRGAIMKVLPGQTFIRWKPAGLYNAMIAPLTSYPIKGVIWYQGEANTSQPGNYSALMQTLIKTWRAQWKQDDLPFIYVQLPNFMESAATPAESNWAALRQQQMNLLSVPHTAMAVAIDAGEWNDIHPENKKDIGLRLALQAEKIAYGNKTIVASGPLYKSMKITGNKIVISFSNTGSGLMAKGNIPLKHFAIAGPDKKYQWADAVIKDNTIVVWSDNIKNPVSVRYAWADNPAGANLYNKEGLPASPFTTDKQ